MPISVIAAVIICAMAITKRNCIICGHTSAQVVFYSQYCPVCLRIMSKGLHKNVRKAALKAAWSRDADSFLCYYTGVRLDVQNTASPFYLTFDHAIPGDNTRFVVCARFVNEMKNETSESEFRTNIRLLAKHFRTGGRIDQALFNDRLATPPAKAGGMSASLRSAGGSPLVSILDNPPPEGGGMYEDFKVEYYRPKPKAPESSSEIPEQGMPPVKIHVENCVICGKKPMKGGIYCNRCHEIIRCEGNGRDDKVRALQAAYDERIDGFRCHYTGFLLDLKNPASPWHLNFDHCFPGRPGKYWLACQIINEMKTELSEEEFRKVVMELAKHFETGEPYDRDIIKFEYWNRPR